MSSSLERLRDALQKAAGQYGQPTDEQRNEWMALIGEVDAAAREDVLELVIGPWTLRFTPDGDDPGVGNLTLWSAFGGLHLLVATTQDDVQRHEWDAFVRGATL